MIKDNTLYVLDFATFREPITLEKPKRWQPIIPMKKFAHLSKSCKDFLHIKNQNYKIENISIYDLSGKIIYSGKSTVINLQNFPTSTYILYIKTEEGYHHFKIIKSKFKIFTFVENIVTNEKFTLFIHRLSYSEFLYLLSKGQDGKPGTAGKNADEIVTTQRKNKN